MSAGGAMGEHVLCHFILPTRLRAVGWVERSEPHHKTAERLVGLAASLWKTGPLDPPYIPFTPSSLFSVVVVLLLCAGPAWAGEPTDKTAQPANPSLESPHALANQPDYRSQVLKYVRLPVAGRRPDFVERIDHKPLRHFCEETAVLVRAWQWTGRGEYAEEARQRLTALMDVWELQRTPGKPWRRVCFFSAHPIIDAYRLLLAGDQLDGDFQKRFRQFAREAFFAQEEGPFNQAFARAAGLAWAAKTLPDLPEAVSWRKAAQRVWNQWRGQGDTTENAAAYNGIAMTYLFLLADGLGTTEQFQEPAARAMFARFRDQVSPLGAMPEYGDSGDAEWGMFHAWGTWAAALERAAVVYHDPSYRWAAARMFHAACHHSAPGDDALAIDAMNTAYALCLADQWRDSSIIPQPGDGGSEVTYRREPGNDRAADKLILAPSRRPGSPFMMTELYARGHHAHEDQLGAVLYYEFGDVPLLHGLGYHNRAAEEANLLLMRPAGEPFPHKSRMVSAGVWQEAALPAKRLPLLESDASGRDLRHFDKLTFRVAEDQPVDLFVENLRLSGPKGDLVLDDFHVKGGWRGGRQELVAGSSPDRQALKIDCRRGTNFVWRAGFNTTFSLRDYDHFEFSWKIEDVGEGWGNSLIFRVDNSPTDFHVVLRPLAAEVTAAHAYAQGPDQIGEFQANGWYTDDTRLVRRMVLLAEGPLIVCDQLHPGPAAQGWQAGPLWHLRSEPEAGTNWYNTPGQEELLVWFSPSPGRTCGVQTATLWSGTRPFTVFAKETLQSKRAVQFVTVLMPHRSDVPARQLAAGISVVGEPDGATNVTFPVPGKTIQMRLAPDGKWSVRR
jgi:hypothetical protein